MSLRKILSAATAAVMLMTALPVSAAQTSTEPTVEADTQTVTLSEVSTDTVETAATYPYQDTSLSFEERAADLVARMTLEEKAAQTGAKTAPAISRLGVHSYYYWREGIHGVARQGGATSFPVSLAMSNTWDRQLMFEVMDITSTEARGKNNRYDLNYWNPTINMARDPRWGRNEETYGEDPYLTSEIGGKAVEGMQGTDEKYLKTMTTLKHYAANNCEGERQRGTSIMNESTMRNYYSKAFQNIIEEYAPAAVMSSYNGTTVYRNNELLTSMSGQKIDYVASSANSYLLTDLLRRTYGFGGFVVGDCGAWDNLYGVQAIRQKLYPDEALENITAPMTVAKAYQAGSSLDCNSGGSGTAQTANAVQQGYISEDLLDIAVYELFLQRMKTGEFDDGATYQDIKSSVIESDEHVAKAEEAAEKSWVLLENNNDTLPLKSDVTNIAIVGDHANEVVLGDYSADMDQMKSELVTPLDGITEQVQSINPNANVELIGNVNDSTPLLNIKSISLVKSTGKSTTLDLSKATSVIGMTKSDGTLTDVTKSGLAIIPDVDFSDVTDIQIEAASLPGMPNVTIEIGYNSASQNTANVPIAVTSGSSDYTTNTAVYNGATGGYNGVANMYITVSANAEFSVENYKTALDKADYIIAYGGTTEADSSESNDRASIDLPSSQSHVQQICDAYPDKTIVVLQTVGQVNVEGFKDKCAAMLWTSYNGQTQGRALGKILIGAVNPSGKLSTTWYSAEDLEKMPIGSARQKIDGIDYNFTNYELSQDINNPTAEYPGRTYQYYTGTPIYPFGYGTSYSTYEYSNIKVDKSAVDANDTVTITADVKNTGSVAGAEVAQLYVSVPGADGKKLPLKQLKGFERVELNPGETKTVSFKLDVSDVCFFDEAAQANYVVNGTYTVRVGASSADTEGLTATFDVSGTIAETIKNVAAVPSGIKLYIAKDASGALENAPANSIDPGVSVALKNDRLVTDFANDGITLSYSSSDTDVAIIDNGLVKAGTKEGTATITVTATKADGSSSSASFPVVTQTKERISAEKTAEYLKQLDEAYNSCPEVAYTVENWQLLNGIYTETRTFIENELLEENIPLTLKAAIEEIYSIPKIELTEQYEVSAVNPNVISDGVIDYSANGIGIYTATETTISGTITKDNPAVIDMQATNDGSPVSGSLIWTVERLDDSGRTAPEIDMNSGKLTIYENGTYKITASDYPNQKYGSITVYANLQIEGESADDGDGANLSDAKDGASGGLNAGSTNSYWLRFDGVKLDKLTDITFRVSQKDAEAKINVSLLPNTDWIVATATAPKTGSWTNWAEVTAVVDRNQLSKLTLDENGCGTIYVQTNKANLDYMKLNYITGSTDVQSLSGGKIKITTPQTSGVLLTAAYDENGALKNQNIQELNASGEYTIEGFANGDKVSVFTWESLANMKPLEKATTITYSEPAVKELTVYNFSDPIFDSFFDSAEGTYLSSGLGMDGYGGWNTDKGGSYTYNGRTYTFTRSLKGGKGDTAARKVFFTPDTDGVVTAIFKASSDRYMVIEQDGKTVQKYGDGNLSIVQANVKGGVPVYVYGGGSNKTLYGVLFEADKSVIETNPTATPEPTPTPTQAPVPDTDFVQTVEFEDYTKSWASSANSADNTSASGGKIIENTRDGDIFYFGERLMDDMLVLELKAAIRNDAGTATATFYAADTTGIDVQNASKSTIEQLLTSENRLGSTTLISDKGWDNYIEHIFAVNSGFTGNRGLFVKLNTDGKYCGNLDYISLKYNLGGATTSSLPAAEDSLTAENTSTKVTVTGDMIATENKYDGTVSEISFSENYGESMTFKKLIVWKDMLTALAQENENGATSILTSAMGTVWSNVTPDIFAEKDPGVPDELVINDIVTANDQLYAGCDGGVLVTMTSCSKCSTAKTVCDFDIAEIECDGDILLLTGANGEAAEISLADARQENIKGEAALELAAEGAILVDVRSAEEFAEYSYSGSINVPVDEFTTWLETVPTDQTIIVYCKSGARAAQAVETAKEMGYTNIYNLGSIDEIMQIN